MRLWDANDNDELKDFYADKEHWDTVPNLHLLDFSANRHKGDNPLSQWVNDRRTTDNAKAFILVPANCSLEFDNFRGFFETRKEIIRGLIRDAVEYVDHPLVLNDDGDDDGDDDQESDLISVYFTDNYNWGKVYAYTWGGTENTDSWPGTEMTYVS